MISEYYANPKAAKTFPSPSAFNPFFTPQEYRQAAKFKIAPAEYKRRCAIVEKAVKDTWHCVGDTGYPHSMAEFKKLGKVLIVGVCQHYDNYGDVDWNEPPYILQVKSLEHPNEYTNCTAGWVVKEEPQPKEKDTNDAC